MPLDPWLWSYIILAVAAVSVASITLYATRSDKKKKKELPESREVAGRWPFKTGHTVTAEETQKAQKELKMLNLEREILSYAIRRLYEAQAEGKISEEERDLLAQGYKDRMLKIKELMSRDESVVALRELEAMQGDLIRLFNERFDDLNEKIEDVRSHLGVEPVEEVPVPVPTTTPTPSVKRAKREHRRSPRPGKTEAEKRIEEIRAEVEKVLERLGQIEVEA
ncbi:MAG: hypothetical protein JSV85_00620 [Candidatus Bathyarchaeota archaeon]|nr:MAG: hypothetical protein JSV85_00620 [Candidatus Bathyarchaeota archaeon]